MVWNWDRANTIVFSWWKTASTHGLIAACLGVLVISLLYEALAFWQRSRDLEALNAESTYAGISLGGQRHVYEAPGKFQRSLLYALRSYFGILLMLIMMTFNGWLISSIVAGAFLGHYFIGAGVGCH